MLHNAIQKNSTPGETYALTSMLHILTNQDGSIKPPPVQKVISLPDPSPVEKKAAPSGRSANRGRKSKAEALSKIAIGAAQAQEGMSGKPIASTSTASPTLIVKQLKADPISEGPAPRQNPARKAMATKRSIPLDLATLCTSIPREMPQRTENRLFGLEHCPVFYPTVAEFAKPMEYIEKVAKQSSEDYGIAKVVPPLGWKPSFSLDSEVSPAYIRPCESGADNSVPAQTFRFKTRLQRLNSMEASARASLNFLEQLYLYHRQQGSAKVSIPTIDGRNVDLWRLRREVKQLGGYREVHKHWASQSLFC